MKFRNYSEWSAAWTEARSLVGDMDRVLELWNAGIPIDCNLRKTWDGGWGYRKNSKPGAEERGEKGVERAFLGMRDQLKLLKLNIGANVYPMMSIYHNFPLVGTRKDQVLSDAVGVVLTGQKYRPVLVEIKTTANDPWYAVVECLKQLRLARAGNRNIHTFLNKAVAPLEKGIWGMVAAPSHYFEKGKRTAINRKVLALLDEIKIKTEARVLLATTDDLREHNTMTGILGNWL